MNDAKALIVNQFREARDFLVGTMHGITPVVNNRPDLFPVTIGARMAHIGSLADMMIVGVVGNETPLAHGELAEKTGYSIPHPGADISDWAPAVEMEIHTMHQYVLAVMAKVDEIIDALPEDQFFASYVFGPMGEMPLSALLWKATTMMFITAGEISTLRILNGLDAGYPES